MKLNKQLIKAIQKLIKASFDKDGKLVEENVKKSVQILKSLPSITTIEALSVYLRGVKQEIKKFTLNVETAYPLKKSELDKIAQMVKEEYSVQEVNNMVDSSVLGGMRVKIGDVVYDDTVGRKIVQMKEAVRD